LTINPIIIYPIWLIEEYASIRLILVCVIATKFPRSKLDIAKISNISFHSLGEKTKTIVKIRVDKAIPAILEVIERKATTGVGELESENFEFPPFQNRA
jgi:hypothetical protein